MHLLITGGNGFVMSNLALGWLAHQSEARVTIADCAPPDATLRHFFAGREGRIQWVQGDIRTPELWASLASEHFDYIVHGATVTSINREIESKNRLIGAYDAIETNIAGTVRCLDFAECQTRLRRMIYVSSGSVYAERSPEGLALPEDESVEPEGIYAITKFTSELLANFSRTHRGVPVVSVRLSGVFGPMDRITASREVRCVPLVIATRALAGQSISVRSLDAVGDFIHAGDVADAVIALLEASATRSPVYNIAHGQTTSIRKLLEVASQEVSGLQFRETGAEDADVNYPAHLNTGRWGAYDLTRISEDTDWTPRPIEESFPAYIEWLKH